MCLAVLMPIREWRCQDIDQVLLHEIIFCLFVCLFQCIKEQ